MKRTPYLTDIKLSKNEKQCAAYNHNDICHLCAEGHLDSTYPSSYLREISNLYDIAPNFTYSQSKTEV